MTTTFSTPPVLHKPYVIGADDKTRNFDFFLIDGDGRTHIVPVKAAIYFDLITIINRLISRYYPAIVHQVKIANSQNWHFLGIDGF